MDHVVEHVVSGHFRDMPPIEMRRERPADHLLVWVLAGGLAVEHPRLDYVAKPGDVALLPPGVPHHYWSVSRRDGWEWLWVHFTGSGADEIARRIVPLGQPARHLGFDERAHARFLELVATAAPAPAGDLRLDSCLFSLLGLVVDLVERGPCPPLGRPDLSAVEAYVGEHLAEPITLADVATASGYSVSQVSRVIRLTHGISPMELVARRRIARAADLLAASTLSVAAIARIVGFPDPYHFSRRFKQIVGVAPSAYRADRHAEAAPPG
jgi:AraC family transcriptional regulator of arabinose operon